MGNLELWESWQAVPKEAQKAIKGGRLSGFTDINPVWRMRELTDRFGPCGQGWVYTVERLWLEPAGEEILCFAQVSLSYKDGGEWSVPIPGIGGSKLLAKESSGPRTCDEGYKMAVTDALSVACKAMGIGADVYWQGGESKYDTTLQAAAPATTPQATKTTSQPVDRKGQWKVLQNRIGLDNAGLAALRARLIERGTLQNIHSDKLTDAQFEAMLAALEEEATSGNP